MNMKVTSIDEVFSASKAYLQSGLSVIPINEDGSKSSAIPWKAFQQRRLDDREAQTLAGRECIAIVAGSISGNLEILDFDEPAVFQPWRDRIESFKPGLTDRLVIVQTPSMGFHVYYRSSEAVERNLKLAQKIGDNGKLEVLIETRGEGGYVIAPPSKGSCHPSGVEYRLLQGDLNAIPVLTSGERTLLLGVARSFNQHVSKSKVVKGDTRWSGMGRPGDVFNSTFTIDDWYDLLEKHGWEKIEERGNVEYWRRPGKDEPGISASLNHQGSNLLYVFSSNAEPFEPDKAYTPFVAYALLEHSGDFSIAAKALVSGKAGPESVGMSHAELTSASPGNDEHRQVWKNLRELLDAPLPEVEEVMKYVEKGSVTQFVATTSAGKSMFLLNASLALGTGQSFPPLITKAAKPRRVLYVEMEVGAPKTGQGIRRMLADERFSNRTIRELALENIRVFTDTEPYGMPFDLSLESHLQFLEREAMEFGAEVIVLDNLSMGFSLTSENDNQEVARVVMKPLNKLARTTSTAVILVHHTGKPGEKGSKAIDALAGRGASNWGNLSRTVYGLMPAPEMGDGYVVLHNGKNKGGPLLTPARLKLNRESLWFEYLEDASDEGITAEAIRDFVREQTEASSAEINAHFLSRGFKQKTIERRIRAAKELGLIWKANKRAKFQVPGPAGFSQAEQSIIVTSQQYCC
jgi:hypothetical protein